MRWYNDENLASKCPEIDIIIGGHDHDYLIKEVNNRWIIKSGSDFKTFSVIDILMNKNDSDSFKVKQIEKITIDNNIPETKAISDIAAYYLSN